MRSSHGTIVLSVILLAGLVAVSAVAAVYWYHPLPDPSEANQEQLVEWLVTRDLGAESPETRRTLARRLEEEAEAGVDWGRVDSSLTPQYRERLWDNIPLLLEPWFLAKMEGYYREPLSARVGYVDRLLDVIERWNGLDDLRPTASDGSARPTLTEMLLGGVDRWKAAAPPPERARIEQFVLVVQTRWFLRRLCHPAA